LRSDSGSTALMTAAAAGHRDIVALLLQHGADVTMRRDDGSTAWTLAVERNDTRVMRLLRAGAKR
jgi:ankyrin repeat protein